MMVVFAENHRGRAELDAEACKRVQQRTMPGFQTWDKLRREEGALVPPQATVGVRAKAHLMITDALAVVRNPTA